MEYIIKSNSYRLLKNKINLLTQNIDKENISYFDLSIDNLKTILEECNYNSLFNDKKAIIVYNSNIFGTKYEYKEDLELLEKYLNNPNKNTILIFITDSISNRKKCVKLIKDNNNLFELNMPDKNNLSKEIKTYLSKNNYKIENNALDLLIKNNLENYDYILNELDKVMIIKKDFIINIDDIKKYTSKLDELNIFDFVDLVVKKKLNDCLKQLDDVIRNNVEPSIIFSNIAAQYRLIYSVKNLLKEGLSEKNISDELSIHPYRIKLAYDNSYNYTNKELEEKLLYIGQLDEKIKKGLIDKYNALKLFLINM